MLHDSFGFDPQQVRELLSGRREAEAIALINHFVEAGSVRAMIAMADLLFDKGDKAASLEWMGRAENAIGDQDFTSPIYLASAYERGLGLGTRPERQQKALALLERVGESGNVQVMHALMTNYLYGINGASVNRERFRYWAGKAAALGSETALQALREFNDS